MHLDGHRRACSVLLVGAFFILAAALIGLRATDTRADAAEALPRPQPSQA